VNDIFPLILCAYASLIILSAASVMTILSTSIERLKALHQSRAAERNRGKLTHFRVVHLYTKEPPSKSELDMSLGRFSGSRKDFNCSCTFLTSTRSEILPYPSIQHLVFLNAHARMSTEGRVWMGIKAEQPICPKCKEVYMNLDELVKMLHNL
ncbi:hypothetical protein PMAYCL1PPCAC_05045, partial [Pristionchus mayeri]